MAPEVFFSVCYGDKSPPKAIQDLHTFTPALLKGYCRHRVQHADYPGIIAEEGHEVRGVYATGLTDANVMRLDTFEGPEYSKVQVEVELLEDGKTQNKGEKKKTNVYVFLSPRYLEKREWDFEEFKKEKMQMWTRGNWAYSESECFLSRMSCSVG